MSVQLTIPSMYWYIHEELAFLVEGHLHMFPFHWPVNDSLYILSDFVYYMILCVIGVAVVKPLIIHMGSQVGIYEHIKACAYPMATASRQVGPFFMYKYYISQKYLYISS